MSGHTRKQSALRGRQLGFGGKMTIHPRQVEWLEEIHQPLCAQVEWAQRVIEASRNHAHQGAFQLDGKLIDRPVIRLAESILASSDNPRPEHFDTPQNNLHQSR